MRHIKIGDFDIDNFNILKSGGKPRYNNNVPIFETGYFRLTSYGVPNNEVNNMRLPFDVSQNECNIIKDKFNDIDNYMITHKNSILSNVPKNLVGDYQYIPCVRTNTMNNRYPDYWIAKWNIVQKDIITPIYVNQNDCKNKIYSSIDNIREFITFNCKMRLIVMIDKVMISPVIKKYLVSFKILAVEVIPRLNLFDDFALGFDFIDDTDNDKYKVAMDEEGFVD